MPQAIVDPEELRRFARNLKKFTTLVEEGMGQLNGQMSTLSKTWRDQEQRKFMEAFEEHVRGAVRLSRSEFLALQAALGVKSADGAGGVPSDSTPDLPEPSLVGELEERLRTAAERMGITGKAADRFLQKIATGRMS